MKELLFMSISLVILSGCQDHKIRHETTNMKDNGIPLYTDNHHVPIINSCFHCDCNN